MNLDPLTDGMVRVVQAMLKGTDFLVHETVRPMHARLQADFDAELQQRGLSSLSSVDSDVHPRSEFVGVRHPLEIPTKEQRGPFDLTNVPDNEARFMYGLGAEVADFSCLGRGVRGYVEQVWLAGSVELKKRGIEHEFFCDLEFGDGG